MSGARTVRLNDDTGFLKIIAIITMTIDHAGKMFFPNLFFLRLIGRIAFPLFCYCMAVGCIYTKNLPKYIARVGLMAILSQPIYVLALGHTNAAMAEISFAANPLLAAATWFGYSMRSPNILFTLLVGLILIGGIREQKYVVSAAAAAVALWAASYLNYGWRGVMLIVLFYLFQDRPLAAFCWIAGFMTWWAATSGGAYAFLGWKFSSQVFALAALPFIFLPTNTGIKPPKWLFYWFYPAHLVCIYLIGRFM